ncbi:MAG TPA: response regulator [Vicinamibacteria bacterium]|nr:response regulator [Vicinamibacteria bacterium]
MPRPRPWIVVADDDPAIRRLWMTALRQAGYRPIEATTGREVLELMRAVLPELVVLDLRMPELTGQEVLTALRHSPTLSHTPVLVVSGHLDDIVGRDLGLNIVARLAKPLDVATFLRAVERALTAPRS